MRSSKYLIAGGAINWEEQLAKYYADRNAQEEKSLREYQAQRAEKVKVAGEESITKVFGQLAQFSSAAMQLKKAIDAKKAKAELEADAEDKADWLLNPVFQKNQEQIIEVATYEYKKEKGEAISQQETAKYIGTIGSIYAQDVEAAHDVLNVSGRRLMNRNELLANYVVATNPDENSMFRDWRDNPRDYPNAHAIYQASSGPQKDAIFKEWLVKKLAPLNLNKTATVALLGKELVRQSNTQSNLNRAGAVSKVAKAENDGYAATLITSYQSGKIVDGIFNVRGELDQNPRFKDQLDANGNVIKTRNQVIDDTLKGILSEQLIDGKLPWDSVSAYLKTGIKHRSTKGEIQVGDILFTPEQINDLVAAGKIGQGRVLALTKQDHMGIVNSALTLKLQGKTAQADEMMKPVYAAGLVPKETLDNYENSKPEAHTPDAYQKGVIGYKKAVGNGFVNVTQDFIDGIDNKQVRDMYQDTFDKLTLHNETAGDDKGNLGTTVWNSFNEGVDFPTNNFDQTTSGLISAELDRKAAPLKLKRILEQYKTGEFIPNGGAINEEVHAFKEGIWARGGGGVKGGTGVYSANAVTGSPDNWKEASGFKRQVLTTHQLEGTTARKQKWTSDFNSIREKYRGTNGVVDYDKLIAEGKAFSDADLVGTKETGNFSDRMYHIASLMERDVGEVFLQTIEHREKNAPDFAAKYGFRKLTNEDLKLDGSSDLTQAKLKARDIVIKNFENIVKQMEEQINSQTAEWTTDMPVGTQGSTNLNMAFNSHQIYQIKDLIRKLRTRKWSQLTPNEQVRIINTMSSLGPSATYRAEP